MDITTIDAVSFATRVGQAAASEIYTLLARDHESHPEPGWFNPAALAALAFAADEAATEEFGHRISELGNYVCVHLVDQGERLFRWGQMVAIVPPGEWVALDIAGKQAFETFVHTTKTTYLGLAVAQQAIANARRDVVPPTLKREDSIFEETESLGTLRPEAIEASGLTARFEREGAEERQRQDDAAWATMWDEAEAENADWDAQNKPSFGKRMAAARAAKRTPMSAGETLVQQQPSKGGRGNKKPVPDPA